MSVGSPASMRDSEAGPATAPRVGAPARARGHEAALVVGDAAFSASSRSASKRGERRPISCAASATKRRSETTVVSIALGHRVERLGERPTSSARSTGARALRSPSAMRSLASVSATMRPRDPRGEQVAGERGEGDRGRAATTTPARRRRAPAAGRGRLREHEVACRFAGAGNASDELQLAPTGGRRRAAEDAAAQRPGRRSRRPSRRPSCAESSSRVEVSAASRSRRTSVPGAVEHPDSGLRRAARHATPSLERSRPWHRKRSSGLARAAACRYAVSARA